MLKRAVFLPVSAAILIAILFILQINWLRTTAQLVDHADQVLGEMNELQKLMIDAETGVRGAILHQDLKFLEPYENAIMAIPLQFEQLQNLISDPNQIERLKEIHEASQAWLQLAEDSVMKIKANPRAKAYLKLNGKQLMDYFRNLTGDFERRESKLRDQHVQAARFASKMVLVIGLLLLLGLVVLLTTFTRNSLLSISNTYQTALKDMESYANDLYESREWFSTTLASIGDAVIVVNQFSEIHFLNPVAEALTGWTLEEARDQPMDQVFNIINEQTREPAFNPVAKVLRDGIIIGLANHTVLIRKDGVEFPIEDSAAPIRVKNGQIHGVVLVFRDVSLRYKTDAALKEAVKSRDNFLSVASHELKTPLTTLKLQLQLAQRQLSTKNAVELPKEKIIKSIDLCVKQTDRLNKLVDSLLDVTRIQQGQITFHFELVNLTQLVHELVDQLSDQFRSAGTPVEILKSEPVSATCDRFRIEQVVTNLLTNAMKYGNSKPIQLSLFREGATAKIKVQDSGIGIAKKDQNFIFERFERAIDSTNISGLGLGLFISHQIIAAHQGRIDVESELGQGATFTVSIPIQSKKSEFTLAEKEIN